MPPQSRRNRIDTSEEERRQGARSAVSPRLRQFALHLRHSRRDALSARDHAYRNVVILRCDGACSEKEYCPGDFRTTHATNICSASFDLRGTQNRRILQEPLFLRPMLATVLLIATTCAVTAFCAIPQFEMPFKLLMNYRWGCLVNPNPDDSA